ncbi:MAG: peptide chain release factor 1 [Eubacteriales bacterium]|jgi:peptide chain release factor 1|nr:peptide chain release factor 1 [Faecalibacterium sp.]MDY3255865.1 peptide chain release factor 1 [Eubacteriales bacterium]MDY6150620.1 peptide chain release factor 1 [Eubacteriales bacterium]CCY04719.1 peptide chain release factor 1 [Faecalibacterium sp. CAG:1138]
MFEKLKLMKERFAYLTDEISKPEVIADRELWQKLVKEHSDLETVIEKYDEYLAAEKSFEEAKELLSSGDDELKELAKAEFEEYKEKMEQLTGELKILLLPKDPNDGKNVVIEVRAGAGGEEAGLFGAELVRMYKRYAERHRWGVEDVTTNVTDLGGVKEVSFLVKGNGAYSKLKFESGVHRVQRVPETESQGRVHTSTATVAVLPEAEDVEVQIDEKDLKIDRFRSGGAGGQHVNKTESAIRITHLPTGIVVVCEDERSQIKNYEKAMKILKTRLYDHFQTMATKAITDKRSAQIGTGDRSERIRTYNFPQGRVSDHRIGLTLYSLGTFMDGDLDEMIEALQIANQNAQLTSIDE